MKVKTFILLIGLITVGVRCLAQVAVTGKVLNHADNKPVAGASIFLSNTTFGAETSDDGAFILSSVKPGKYELVITVIGFDTYRQKIVVDNERLTLPDIHITPKTNELKEVVIRVDPNRKRNLDWFYERFKTEFLGTTDLAKDCKILNPEVLDIDYDDASNTITASSSDFLEIENNALGYRIKYLLTHFKYRDISKGVTEIYFEGPSLFTEMKGTPQQERRWQEKREEVYEGSARRFLRSVLSNLAAQNGFRVLRFEIYHNPERPPDTLMQAKIELFKRLRSSGEKRYKDSLSYWTKKYELPDTIRKIVNFPIDRDNVIEPAGQNGLFALNCNNDWLYITYNKNHRYPSNAALYNLDKPENTENTLMRFNSQDAFFDINGVISNSAVSFRGVWGRGRVAWLLPTDYDLPQQAVVYGDTVLNNMAEKLEGYATARKDEKVYLHLDKANYGFGDTIWYKAYTVAGQRHQLSALNGVLYVELISPKDSLVTRQVIPLVSGIGWSDIPLAHTLLQGEYRIRAYTRWMQNRPDYICDQRIRLGGIPPAIVKQTEKCDVQFFPEGGEMVNSVRCRVAVKAIGANGLGQDIKGTIEDNTGNVVADFATQHLGMGVFAIIPEAGKSYKAKVNIPGEASFTVDLPKAREEGYTLAVNNSGKDSVYVRIATNEQTLNIDKGKTIYIIAQSNGKVYYTTEGKLGNIAYTAGIEKSRFPEGITQFTLLSQSGEPLAERVAFIRNEDDELNLHVSTAVQAYNTRDKVKLELAAKDNDEPVTGSFSVSVINESKVQPDENGENTILNNLLLTSELKGYIEQPNYYFANQTDKAKTDLDILMLTQGYRRYDWKQVLNNNIAIQQYKPEPTQELSGTLTTPDGKAIPHCKVTLLATKQNLVRDTTADASGRFTFTNLNITDTATLVIRARKANNGSNVKIKAFVPDYPKITPAESVTPEIIIPTDTAQQPIAKTQYSQYRLDQKNDSLKDGKILNEVAIKGKKLPKPDELNGYGALAEYDADMRKLAQEQVVTAHALTDVIPGLTYSAERGFYYDQKPITKLVIDGVIARNHDAVDFLSVKDLVSVRVIGITPSVLVLTTRRYAGTDTMKTAGQLQYSQYSKAQHDDSLKNGKLLNTVIIKGKKLPKPDEFNNHGTTPEFDVDMKRLNQEFVTVKDGVTIMVPGLHYIYINRRPKLVLEHDTDGVRLIVDGVERNQADIDTYSLKDIDNIRLIQPTLLNPAPLLIITSKNYAGTDTLRNAGQLQYNQYAKAQHEDSLKNGKLLKTVTINARKEKPKPDMSNSSNLHGGGNADQVIMGDDLGSCINISDCLTGHVFGVSFKRGVPINNRNGATMSVILDGNKAANLNDVTSLDVYSIEVLRSGAARSIYGTSIGGGGALVITTRRGTRGAKRDTMRTAGQLQYSQYARAQHEDSLKNGKLLKTVTINGIKKPNPPDLSNSSNLNGPGHADQVIMYDQMGYGPNLSDRLTGKMLGVTFNNKGWATNNRNNEWMSVIIDGIVMDHMHTNDITADDVYSIEVLRSVSARSVYGNSVELGGALVITTKRGTQGGKKDTMKTAGQLQYSQYAKQQHDDSVKNGRMLKTVTVKGIKKPEQPKLQFSSNLNGPGHADQVLMWNQLSDGCINLSDCLYGKLTGVMITGPSGGVDLKRRAYLQRAQGRLGGTPAMAVIIDGVIMDGSHLDDVPTDAIYSIEVLRSGGYLAIYGSNAPGGAIVITTKRGGEGTAYFTQAQPNGIMTFPFAGFYKAKAFYVPKYDYPKTSDQPADLRGTIYWNPNILTDKDGKASLDFYNNDTKGTYRVVVEGIDDDGKLGRVVYRYTVH